MSRHARPAKPAAPRVRLEASTERQNLQIPPSLGLPTGLTDVEVMREGNMLMLKPILPTWDDFFDSPPATEDFMRAKVKRG